MSKEWTQSTARMPAGSRPTLPIEPITGPHGKFLGRVIIEIWEPSDGNPDGLTYVVQGGDSPAGADSFSRAAVAKLHAQLQKQQRIP